MPLPKVGFHPDEPGPLRGVRVLDFSRLVAGNMLSLQLADLGAEVVKVEAPGHGDTLRDWRFMALIPTMLGYPAIMTAYLFHLRFIAEAKG